MSKLYAIDENELRIIKDARDRLYTENRLKGDEMRDMAQSLGYVVDHAFEITEAMVNGPMELAEQIEQEYNDEGCEDEE